METKQLKYYKVFLASSNELSTDREHFCLFIDKMNRVLNKFGYQIEVERWEIVDPRFPEERNQDDYNEILKGCDECIILFWKRFGKYSDEELQVAFEEFKAKRNLSRLVVYCKDADESEITKELKKFKKSFPKRFGERYYAQCSSIDRVELDFLLFFIDKNVPNAKLTIQDSNIVLDGEKMGNISNLSMAYYNKPYQKLNKEVSDLGKDLQALKRANPYSFSIPLLENKLFEKKKELEELEKSLMDMAQTITRITSTDPDNERVLQAQKEFAEGNYHNALAILNREELLAYVAQCNKDYESAIVLTDKAKDKYRAAVETIVLRIQYLSVAKLPNWFKECKELFNQAGSHARKCYADVELATLLFNQAVFLQNNNQFTDSLNVYEEVLKILFLLAEVSPEIYLLDLARTLNNMGVLHINTGKHAEAEAEYKKVLEINRKLAEASSEYFLSDLATTLNNLCVLHRDTGRYVEAEVECKEALEIRRKLSESNLEAQLPYLAMTLNNLGALHGAFGRYDEAEVEYMEALEIRRKLARLCPEVYQPDLAMSLNNLGVLHSDLGKHAEAEMEYKEALEIRRKLAESSPEAHQPEVAMTLNNLGNTHNDMGRYVEAEAEFNEALEIRRKMAESSPEANLQYVATTLYNLGNFHCDKGSCSKAEVAYKEALEIRRKLAESSAEANLPDLAMILNNLGALHCDTNRYSEAEMEFKEALEIRRKLAESSSEIYFPNVARTLYNFAILRIKQGNLSDAEELAQESLKKYQIMAKLNPIAFNQYVDKLKKLLESIKR
jgi:Tfp pilus assembly protein PilF